MKLNLEKSPLQLFSRKLVKLKYIQHIQTDLKENDVSKLSTKLTYLNQTYIFHLIANWQDFIETLVKHTYQRTHKLNSVVKNNLENELKKFNTPNIKNIDSLFKNILGISKITECFNTKSLKRDDANTTLNKILTTRHQIAHTGKTNRQIDYQSNFEDMQFLYELATLLEEKVNTIPNK